MMGTLGIDAPLPFAVVPAVCRLRWPVHGPLDNFSTPLTLQGQTNHSSSQEAMTAEDLQRSSGHSCMRRTTHAQSGIMVADSRRPISGGQAAGPATRQAEAGVRSGPRATTRGHDCTELATHCSHWAMLLELPNTGRGRHQHPCAFQ